MRRSARVVKRKKYVDDLDLNLSEDESNDAEKTSEPPADDCDGLPSTIPQRELFEVRLICQVFSGLCHFIILMKHQSKIIFI